MLVKCWLNAGCLSNFSQPSVNLLTGLPLVGETPDTPFFLPKSMPAKISVSELERGVDRLEDGERERVAESQRTK